MQVSNLTSSMNKLPKIIFTDIDGVWTDGGMYYDQTGNEWKKFNTADSMGVNIARYFDIPVVIITGEDTQIVKNRAAKLQIQHLYMGITDKLAVAQQVCQQMGVSLSECAHIGDDLNDLALLRQVGFSAAPANAPDYIKDAVHHITQKAGGDGAFRDFVEHIVRLSGDFDAFLKSKGY